MVSMLRSLLVAVLLVLPSLASAQPSRLTASGCSGWNPPPARRPSPGRTASGSGEDVNALFSNPALLGESDHGQLAVSYLNHLADINAGFVVYARNVERLGGTVAGSVRFLSYGDFERADAEGTRTGDTFGASDAIVTLSYARPAGDRLHVGGSAHAVFSSIDDASANALAADFGVTYALPEQGLALSASLHNLGVVTSDLGAEGDELPDGPPLRRLEAAAVRPAPPHRRGLRPDLVRERERDGAQRDRPPPLHRRRAAVRARRSRCARATTTGSTRSSRRARGSTSPASASASG